MEKRKKNRIDKRLTVRYGQNNTSFSGITKNVSEKGLFIQAGSIFPTGTILRIRLSLEQFETIELWGIVRWNKQIPFYMVNVISGGMGIELINPPEKYSSYILSLRSKETLIKDNKEIEDYSIYQVSFDGIEQFIQEYNQNIRNGGIFIKTDQLRKPGEIVILSISLPKTNEVIKVQGSVVYAIDTLQAVKQGVSPGMGIAFVKFKKNHQQRLENYVNKVIPNIKANNKLDKVGNITQPSNVKLEWEGYHLYTLENIERHVEERGGIYKLAILKNNKYEVFYINKSSNLLKSLKDNLDTENDDNFYILKMMKEGKCFFNVAYLFKEDDREEFEKALYTYYNLKNGYSDKVKMAQVIM